MWQTYYGFKIEARLQSVVFDTAKWAGGTDDVRNGTVFRRIQKSNKLACQIPGNRYSLTSLTENLIYGTHL
jgi:hypothetical protein